MGFLFRKKGQVDQAALNPADLLKRAKEGDGQAREDLIRYYQPFILKVAARVCGRYLRVGEDDEVSISLIAFNEAIDQYSYARGVAFLTFSETVIRRRLIDYYRRQNTLARRERLLTEFEEQGEEGEVTNPLPDRAAALEYARQEETADRREEIERYRTVLGEYGITLRDLAVASPRHEDARERAIDAARVVAGVEQYREHLLRRKELPLTALARDLPVSRKTLERQRKYIIAVALILMGEYPFLRRYVDV